MLSEKCVALESIVIHAMALLVIARRRDCARLCSLGRCVIMLTDVTVQTGVTQDSTWVAPKGQSGDGRTRESVLSHLFVVPACRPRISCRYANAVLSSCDRSERQTWILSGYSVGTALFCLKGHSAVVSHCILFLLAQSDTHTVWIVSGLSRYTLNAPHTSIEWVSVAWLRSGAKRKPDTHTACRSKAMLSLEDLSRLTLGE